MGKVIIRNVHREPIGPHIDWDELTDDCKEQLAAFVHDIIDGVLEDSAEQEQDPDGQG